MRVGSTAHPHNTLKLPLCQGNYALEIGNLFYRHCLCQSCLCCLEEKMKDCTTTTVSEICQKYAMKQTELANRFGIPLRTVQEWHAGRRTPPDYIIRMMCELLEQN